MKRPALLLGWIPRIIVPVARSLHRHGVPVDVVSFVGYPRMPSRSIREFRNVPRPDVDRKEFVHQLRDFITRGGHDLLIATDDCMLTAVTEHYHDLADLLQVACPPPAITRLVLNKSATLDIAERCGIKVPRSEVVSSSSQLLSLVDKFPFPWVVKPAQKETRMEEVKSWTLMTADDVAASFPNGSAFEPPMLVQEYCAGKGVGVEILLHRGQFIAGFQHRRLKELPYTGGYSVTAIAEPLNQSLLKSSLTLLKALQWDGIAMVEYKINPDGRAVLMEINGRYWGTISLPISAGLDFPWYHWQLAHGKGVEIPKNYAVGMKWRWTVGYLARLYTLLGQAPHSASAREILRANFRGLVTDFKPSVHDATLTLSDPMPSLITFLRAVRYFSIHTVTRAFRWPVIHRHSRSESALTTSRV